MDEEQVLVAAAFVNELLDLAVVGSPLEGNSILSSAPLFVVPKEGQEGQWRVIADMLRCPKFEVQGQRVLMWTTRGVLMWTVPSSSD
jgi:hypothetical protein